MDENTSLKVLWIMCLIYFPDVTTGENKLKRIKRDCSGGSFAEIVQECEESPNVAISSTNFIALMGDTVTLGCNVTSNPPATNVYWIFTNKAYRSKSIRENSDTNKYSGSSLQSPSLILYNADSTDEGSYTCYATNSLGTSYSDTAELHVKTAESPTVTISSNNFTVLEGDTVTLGCNVTSNPPATNVYWTFTNNEYISKAIRENSDTNKYFGSSLQSPSLILYNADSTDEGSYTCYATNRIGTSYSDNAKLHVETAPQCGGNFTKEEGQLIFPGNVSPNVPCFYLITVPQEHLISFLLTVREAGKSNAYRIQVYDGPTSSSSILGDYYYVNSDKQANSSGNSMLIKYTIAEMTTVDIVASYTSIIPDKPPKVTLEEVKYSVLFGKTIELVCNVTSNIPITSLKWQRQTGSEVTYITTGNGNYRGGTSSNPSLTIVNVSQVDQGNYTCIASNQIGTSRSSPITLEVKVYPPKITLEKDNYSILFGKTVRISCNVSSDLPIISLRWQHETENQIIDIQPGSSKYYGGTPSDPSMTIRNATQNDQGNYTCMASNQIGTSQSSPIALLVEDIDECLDKSTCSQNCQNTFGSYFCQCWEGYTGQSGRNCKIDYSSIERYLTTLVLAVTVVGDIDDQTFQQTVNNILENDEEYRETTIVYIDRVTKAPKSVVHFGVVLTKSGNDTVLLNILQQHISTQTFGNLTVQNDILHPVRGVGHIINVRMKNIYTVFEGTSLNIPCNATGISMSGEIRFAWTLNGYKILPTSISRIQTAYSKTSKIEYQSMLTLNNIKQADAGELQCFATVGSSSGNSSTEVFVYKFSIESKHSTVRVGANTSVMCSVFPSIREAKSLLKMCRNGKIINTTELVFQHNVVRLNLLNLNEDVTIGCGWTNDSCSKSIDMKVFTPEITPCKEERLKNITWTETFPGITSYQNCTSGFKGLASRYCQFKNYTGYWRLPSFVNCTREVLDDISNELERIKDGVEVKELISVLKNFTRESAAVSKNNESTTGDIKSSVEILTTASQIVEERQNVKPEETKETAKEIFIATDNILESGTQDSWKELQEETGENKAARVMSLVTNVTTAVLKSLSKNESFDIVRDNMVLQVKRTEIGQIVFPNNENSAEKINYKSQVVLTKDTIYHSLDVNETLDYTAVYYKTISQLLPTASQKGSENKVGSPVLSFSLPKNIIKRKLDPPIQLIFETIESNLSHVRCGYWNYDLPNGGNWATDGCNVGFSNKTVTDCRCDHLTNFAVLLSLSDIKGDHHHALSTLSIIGCVISIVALTLTLLIYGVEWKNLTSDKSVVLVLLCIVLLISYVVFLAGIDKTENKDLCTAVAVCLHFLFLVVLCLMAAEGVIHAILVIAVFPGRRSINKILIPASFGIPFIIVMISCAVTRFKGYGNKRFCWLSTESGLIFAFFVPCILTIVSNLVITGLVLKKLFSTRATMSKTRKEKLKSGIRSIVILAPLFGLTWLFGMLVLNDDASGLLFSYLFVIFNSLQGLFIFIAHGVLNKNVQKSVNKRVSRLRKDYDIFSTKSTASTGTSSRQPFGKSKTKFDSTDHSEGTPSMSVANPVYDSKLTDNTKEGLLPADK